MFNEVSDLKSDSSKQAYKAGFKSQHAGKSVASDDAADATIAQQTTCRLSN